AALGGRRPVPGPHRPPSRAGGGRPARGPPRRRAAPLRRGGGPGPAAGPSRGRPDHYRGGGRLPRREGPLDRAARRGRNVHGGWVAGGGGAGFASRSCPTERNGVQLVCLQAATGQVRWRARAVRLAVADPNRRMPASVTVRGATLRVTRESFGGAVVEVLDLR